MGKCQVLLPGLPASLSSVVVHPKGSLIFTH